MYPYIARYETYPEPLAMSGKRNLWYRIRLFSLISKFIKNGVDFEPFS